MKNSLILLLISLNVFAQDVYTLKKGDIAPIDGVLFSHEKELSFRVMKEDLTIANNLNRLLEEKQVILEKRIEIRDKQIDDMSKQLSETKSDSIWSNIGFFVIGAVITGGIAYGVSKTVR